MKVSRKVGRSSHHNSTSISHRKKKKSNEKNSLGKSGKRSRGHKRVKTYKRVKIFHKGGAHKIEYDAGLVEYKKISWVPFFNDKKTGKFKVSISVYRGRTYPCIKIKLTTADNETMTLELPIENYTGNLHDLTETIRSSLFTSDQKNEKYTFNFPSNNNFFVKIIEESTQLLNKLIEEIEEQKKLKEKKEKQERIDVIVDKVSDILWDSLLSVDDEKQHKNYVDLITRFKKYASIVEDVKEYEHFKTKQIERAVVEIKEIERCHINEEKDNRKLLVVAVLNRIIRLKLLLMTTSCILIKLESQKHEVMKVISEGGDVERYLEDTLIPYIDGKIEEIKQVKETQNTDVETMVNLMTRINTEKGKNELDYSIIGKEWIGEKLENGNWGGSYYNGNASWFYSIEPVTIITLLEQQQQQLQN